MLFRVFVLMFLCAHSFALIGGGDDDRDGEKEHLTYSACLKGPPLREDQWLELPQELWMMLLNTLSLSDAVRLPLVCRKFSSFAQEFSFWVPFASLQQIEMANEDYENRALSLKKGRD